MYDLLLNWRCDFYFLPTYNIGNLKKTLYDFLMIFYRETDKSLYFSFSVGLDVSKIFSPHYTGAGPYIIVSRMTVSLYLGYYNFSTTGFNLDEVLFFCCCCGRQ